MSMLERYHIEGNFGDGKIWRMQHIKASLVESNLAN